MNYAYVRFSADKQADGDSLVRQKSGIGAYCERHGLTVDRWLTDEGLSGFKGHHVSRGELGRFLAMAEAGEIEPDSTLLVESLDRLGREGVLRQIQNATTILNAGVTIITTIDGERLTMESMGGLAQLLTAVVRMGTANEESVKKTERGRMNWEMRRKSGKNLTPFQPRWLTKDLKVIPERQAVIERILTEVVEGLGANQIARRLNTEGIPTFAPLRRSGEATAWHNGSIIYLVRNRTLIGEFTPKRQGQHGERLEAGDPIPDYYEPVVSTALFHAANQAMNGRGFKNRPGRRGESVSNLFSRLARCEHCWGPMYRRSAAKYAYLVCAKGARRACSNTKGVNYERFEAAFLDRVTEFELPRVKADDKAAAARLAEAEHALATITARVEVIAEQLIDLPSQIMRRKLGEAEAQVGPLAQAVKSATDHLAQIRASLAPAERQEQLTQAIAKMRDPKGDHALVRAGISRALRAVVDQITFDDQGNGLVIILDGLRNYLIRPDGTVEAAHAMPNVANGQFDRGDARRRAEVERLRSFA